MKRMRILIADNQPQVRFALRIALEQRPGLKTIGEAIDAEDLLEQSKMVCPDLVLIDWGLVTPMAELIRALRQVCRYTRVIILSSRQEARELALATGAD